MGTNAIGSTGTFSLNSGAALGIGSTAGIVSSGASGNLQTSGTRTLNSAANYTYNGSLAQVTGNGLPATINNLTINNSAGVTLSAGVTANNVTITSGTLDANSLNISVGGDWTNSGTFTPGTGTTTFNGTSTQTITKSGGESFYNLTIANTGAGNISLGSNVTTTNVLTLTSGVITTGSYYFILSNTTAANLSYTNGFIYGNFRRYIASNASTYLFPVGNGTASTDRHRASFVNNSLTGVTYLDASVVDFTQAAPNNDANLSTTQGGTLMTSTVGESAGQTVIWTLTPNASPSGGSYGVQLYVENTTLSGSDDNTFCPLKRTPVIPSYAEFLTYESLPTTVPASGAAGRIYNSGNGYAQRTGYTSFSNHAIGKGRWPLPVELLNFDAKINDNVVDVSWKTASEINCDNFLVTKSHDGNSFVEIVKLKCAGNSSTMLSYQATDYEPYNGISYYRLRQTDFNGSYHYSNIVAVDFNTDESAFNVYPSLSTGDFNIFFKGEKGKKVFLVIRDMLGQELYSNGFVPDNDLFIQSINLSNKLAPGVYMIFASCDGRAFKGRIVIE